MCEVSVAPTLPARSGARIPVLSVVIGGDRALMEDQGGYEIDIQGKRQNRGLRRWKWN
jgi:hypothetical protein